MAAGVTRVADAWVLVSGGLDSVTALHAAHAAGTACGGLSFSYGARHNRRELARAAWQCRALGLPHVVLRLDFMARHFESALLIGGAAIPCGHYEDASMRQTVVPFRNGIMLAIAAGFAESRGARAVVLAAHGGDHAIYPDCRAPFLAALAEALRLGTYAGIELRRPFVDWDKAAIVRRGQELGVDFKRTWSCYVGGRRHCGACGTCVERREAFLRARVPDPTPYESQAPLPDRPNALDAPP